jgi:hypothetical protein
MPVGDQQISCQIRERGAAFTISIMATVATVASCARADAFQSIAILALLLVRLSHQAELSNVPAGKSVPVLIIRRGHERPLAPASRKAGYRALGSPPRTLPFSFCRRATFRRLLRCDLDIFLEFQMSYASQIQEHMDVISSDRKTVGKVDHLDGPDKIKLTKQSSPNGEHHHFIPVAWIDHVDQHVHLNKTGADVTAHWEHEGRV